MHSRPGVITSTVSLQFYGIYFGIGPVSRTYSLLILWPLVSGWSGRLSPQLRVIYMQGLTTTGAVDVDILEDIPPVVFALIAPVVIDQPSMFQSSCRGSLGSDFKSAILYAPLTSLFWITVLEEVVCCCIEHSQCIAMRQWRVDLALSRLVSLYSCPLVAADCNRLFSS